MKYISIVKADYVKDYIIEITFSDGKVNQVDFTKQLMAIKNDYYATYQKESKFKKFKIENGNIVWGKNWDLIFPIMRLYKNNLDAKAGRKKVADKKLPVRLYLRESEIEANGGMKSVIDKCLLVLKIN